MTTIRYSTRRVRKGRGKRVTEYRAAFYSKGRLIFNTPQWYSRRKDLDAVVRNHIRDCREGRIRSAQRHLSWQ